MEIPRHPNERINWEAIIRGYASETDMEYSQAMRWCSERSSLQVAAELMGIQVIGHHDTDASTKAAARTTLDQLGAFLTQQGYRAPKMFELGQARVEELV